MAEPHVSYFELHGILAGGSRSSVAGDIVVLSNLHGGSASGPPREGICVRFVGRGRESYTIAGRGVHLDEGQVMVSRMDAPEDIALPKSDRRGTIGLCVLVTPADGDPDWPMGPLVTSAAASPLGPMMQATAAALLVPTNRKSALASQVAWAIRLTLPSLSRSIVQQAAAMEAVKPATRHEMVRRAHAAQSYLHSVMQRAVPLEELAAAAGSSPFQLLRAFQRCFGQTPADYHRRLRLRAAVEESHRKDIPLCAAAPEFGFADGSSFSHAYRRAFGRAPARPRLSVRN